MKLFKSGKKKKGLFGSRKKSKPLTPTGSGSGASKHHSVETESSSHSSQNDAAPATLLSSSSSSPGWVHGSGSTGDVRPGGGLEARPRDDANAAAGDGNRALPAAYPAAAVGNPFDEEDDDNEGSQSSESECDIGDMETPADSLNGILAHLEERERREWADVDVDGSDEPGARRDAVGMLRKTVVCMDVDSEDVEVQRLGTRILHHLSKLRRKEAIDARRETTTTGAGRRWYDDNNDDAKKTTPGRAATGVAGREDEELMTDALEAVLQAMEAFPDDEDLIESACQALESTSEVRTASGSAKRTLEEVLLAMEGFADNPVVVSSSLGLLRNLSDPSKTEAKTDDLRRRLAKYALPSILHGMKEHRDDLELYTKGCKALANFTKDDPNAQRILACKEALGLRIISEGLKYWEIDDLDEFAVLQRLRLQLAAGRVLENLSTHQSLEVKGKIALGGGAAQIIERVLEALVFIGKDLIDNNYNVGEFGAVHTDFVDEDDEVVISLAIMQNALRTIENLADIESVVTKDDRSPHMPTIHRSSAVDNSSAEDIQRQLSKAVKPVLNTIRQHPNRKSLQHCGLACARQLTVSHADSIANHGGISTFLNVLSSSPGTEDAATPVVDSTVHERALSCLTGLLSPSSNADGLDLVASMETEDGLDAIFRTIRRYQSETAVIETAYESLFYLSCRVRVVLASIVGRHPSIAGGVGAQAARRLQSQLCLEENVFVMLATLNQYFEASESISQRGLGLLLNIHAFLTQDEQQPHRQPDILASNGGIRLVLAVMRRHGLAVGIQEYGVGLLAGVLKSSVSHDAIRREFYDEEGISTILAAMMIHPGHAAVQSHGCDVLIQLMAIDKHPAEEGYPETAALAAYYKKCVLEETNAVALVRDSLDRFRTNQVVQRYGTALLQELSRTTTVRPLAALPSKAASTATKLGSSILSSTSRISSSIRSSLE
mmetsp:Transcript_19663/g.45860  ORF Transcript_19663/g.45860 Transcript_19663/m.45860 type:complete len:950 (+) Transcript_19663:152-3001(+)